MTVPRAAILLLLSTIFVSFANNSSASGPTANSTLRDSEDSDDGSGGSGTEPKTELLENGSENIRPENGSENIRPAQEIILLMGCVVVMLCTGTDIGFRC